MYFICYLDGGVDGDTLLLLTERGAELLVPQIGKRMKFLNELELLKKQNKENGKVTCPGQDTAVPNRTAQEMSEVAEVPDHESQETIKQNTYVLTKGIL